MPRTRVSLLLLLALGLSGSVAAGIPLLPAITTDQIVARDDYLAGFAGDGLYTPPPRSENAHTVDLDGDGDLDVVAGSELGGTVDWYENDGKPLPSFTRRTIVSGLDLPKVVFSADIDGDGDRDVVAAAFGEDSFAWYENDAQVPPSFVARTIGSIYGAVSGAAADLDGDADADLVTASWTGGVIEWFENDGADPPVFTRRLIEATAITMSSVTPGDLDGDTDPDLVGVRILCCPRWYENLLPGSPPGFQMREVAGGTLDNLVVDVDGDGDNDILASTEQLIGWVENEGDVPPSLDVSYLVTVPPEGANELVAADLDDDGDLDVAAVRIDGDAVTWYENGGGFPPVFTPHPLDTASQKVTSIATGDLDDDGDIDLVTVSPGGDVHWYENRDGRGQFMRIAFAPVAAGAVPSDGTVSPMTVEKIAGETIRISWGASCLDGDVDYGVYAGDLGSFSNHRPIACTTAGLTTTEFAPSSGDRYYLVVPQSTNREGSYGSDSEGVERGQGAVACRGLAVGSCD